VEQERVASFVGVIEAGELFLHTRTLLHTYGGEVDDS
jgi:hypothetical protein